MKKLLSIFLCLVLLSAILSACGTKEEGQDAEKEKDSKKTDAVFKIGAIPDQNAADLNRSMGELADYLSKETGFQVEYVPSVDYAALVTAFERGEIQLAWFGGLTGVQARSLVPEAEAIAQRPMDKEFHSVYIANSETAITKLEDVKGKSFTFGSESSTSGHLMPRYFMEQAGISPDKDLNGAPNFSGSHDKTYKLVESGAFQAGALNEQVWKSAIDEKLVDTNKVKVIHTTPAYFDYNWTINDVSEKFGNDAKDKVKQALLSINGEQEEIMSLFGSDSFIETNNDNYKAIEEVAKELKIIK
ncbi:putative selenate ABC transporter substrate-binding protein [Peribacillus saganii]|uniref:Putative selenate ABC transporter substrate-binding protein n=1 Tax=Peribacillus saganii TaxID=2303992 RepID=A0A372LTA1_9BACI|nr:putative selenate ABC transporter substrate-binding protein [Peribacillus saganii]RFU71419.1 putative selenate ABC transporter substrate-binding protein [Peribacillus saganii]